MKPTDSNYDFAGLNSRRVLTNFLRWKVMPFGFLGKGPGVVWLLNIALRHGFGKAIATVQIKHEKPLANMRRWLNTLRKSK